METITQTLYQITATVNGRQIPTFYLDAQVQGVTNCAQAEKIARDILTINGFVAFSTVNVAAFEVNYEIAPWSMAQNTESYTNNWEGLNND